MMNVTRFYPCNSEQVRGVTLVISFRWAIFSYCLMILRQNTTETYRLLKIYHQNTSTENKYVLYEDNIHYSCDNEGKEDMRRKRDYEQILCGKCKDGARREVVVIMWVCLCVIVCVWVHARATGIYVPRRTGGGLRGRRPLLAPWRCRGSAHEICKRWPGSQRCRPVVRPVKGDNVSILGKEIPDDTLMSSV